MTPDPDGKFVKCFVFGLLMLFGVIGWGMAHAAGEGYLNGVRASSSALYDRAFDVTLDDNGPEGAENVAVYATSNHYGRGTGWAGVFEMQDHGGAFWGVEVDAMTFGPYRPYTHRVGVGIVLGRSGGRTSGATEVDKALWIAAVDDGVTARYGVRVDAHCSIACISLRGGESIAVSDDPVVPVFRFDPATGFVGLFTGNLCVWCVHAVTGEEKRLWRT